MDWIPVASSGFTEEMVESNDVFWILLYSFLAIVESVNACCIDVHLPGQVWDPRRQRRPQQRRLKMAASVFTAAFVDRRRRPLIHWSILITM